MRTIPVTKMLIRIYLHKKYKIFTGQVLK